MSWWFMKWYSYIQFWEQSDEFANLFIFVSFEELSYPIYPVGFQDFEVKDEPLEPDTVSSYAIKQNKYMLQSFILKQ